MDCEKLNEMLELRRKWLRGESGGARANLARADLAHAHLTGAYLARADLTGANLPHHQIVPEEGGFIAFKATRNGVVKLWIPPEAHREGDRVYPDGFDDDIRIQCSNGIHFFLTRAEAEEWC